MRFDPYEILDYGLEEFIEEIDELELEEKEFAKLYRLSASLDHKKFVHLHENYKVSSDELSGAMNAAINADDPSTFEYLLKEVDWKDSYLEYLMKNFSSYGDDQRIEVLCRVHPILASEINVEDIFNNSCRFSQEFYDARSKDFLDDLLSQHLGYNNEEGSAEIGSIIEAFEKKNWAPDIDPYYVRLAFEFDETFGLADWLCSYANEDEKVRIIENFAVNCESNNQEVVLGWIDTVDESNDKYKALYGLMTRQVDIYGDIISSMGQESIDFLEKHIDQDAREALAKLRAVNMKNSLNETTISIPPSYKECVDQAKSESQEIIHAQRAQARRL
ncbi:hypothetical protein [Xanthomonas axonopodis]